MGTSIGARQIHWHLLVLALAELEDTYNTSPDAFQLADADTYRYALFTGIQKARNLIIQEGWNPELPSYPTTKIKFDYLVSYWNCRHKLAEDDPCIAAHTLEDLLLETANTKYLVEKLQIQLRFITE